MSSYGSRPPMGGAGRVLPRRWHMTTGASSHLVRALVISGSGAVILLVSRAAPSEISLGANLQGTVVAFVVMLVVRAINSSTPSFPPPGPPPGHKHLPNGLHGFCTDCFAGSCNVHARSCLMRSLHRRANPRKTRGKMVPPVRIELTTPPLPRACRRFDSSIASIT